MGTSIPFPVALVGIPARFLVRGNSLQEQPQAGGSDQAGEISKGKQQRNLHLPLLKAFATPPLRLSHLRVRFFTPIHSNLSRSVSDSAVCGMPICTRPVLPVAGAFLPVFVPPSVLLIFLLRGSMALLVKWQYFTSAEKPWPRFFGFPKLPKGERHRSQENYGKKPLHGLSRKWTMKPNPYIASLSRERARRTSSFS